MASIELLKVKNGIHGLLLCLKEAEVTKVEHLASIATELSRIQGQAESLDDILEKIQAMGFCAFVSKAITARAMAMVEAYELAGIRAERENAKCEENQSPLEKRTEALEALAKREAS